ncbi:ribonuclease H2 subunit A [Enteropsectra breve]|nr:ribonuclease H2 subunit A [Enteropsectra breve]
MGIRKFTAKKKPAVEKKVQADMSHLDALNEFYTQINKTSKRVVAGIDEAGRGPVIGPMVYGLYVMEHDAVTKYKDSKILSKEAREGHFSGMASYAYYAIDPQYITAHMNGGTKNLNEIARGAVITLLNELKEKCSNVDTVYIDGLGNNASYKTYLQRFFDFNFVIENKADSLYQPVSGASIVAKVTRDRIVESYGYDCGSGYPGDPRTVAWLGRYKNNPSELPKEVRKSWATVKNMLGNPVVKATFKSSYFSKYKTKQHKEI